MTKPLVQVSSADSAAGRHQAIVARRIRFFPEAPPGANVLRTFRQPRPCVAVEEAIDLAELPAQSAWPEPIDHFTAVLIPPGAISEGRKLSEDWMAAPDNCEAISTIAFGWNSQKIQWRPGRLLVQGSREAFEGILKAVVDFTFYEGELRTLEHEIEEREAQAQADVRLAHRIRLSDRKHWGRIGEMIEHFYLMRVTYARLEPQLAIASRTLPGDVRQVMSRLLDEAEVSDRLEGASNRLEACEDIYEGANDRIAEYRWYIGGQWLEVTIVVLLIVEVALLVTELSLRHWK
jgi:hypothetical protein